ncbi:mechanosensitive ion channel family protein [Thiolapillus sp.]
MNDLENNIRPLLDLMGGHPWLKAGVVALTALVAAYVLTGILKAFLKRLVIKTSFDFDDQLVEIIRPPLFYMLLMIGLSIAVRLTPLGEHVQINIMSVLQSISILIWMVFAIRFAKIVLQAIASRAKGNEFIQPRTLPLFNNLATIAAIAVATYLIFSAWGIDMTAWLASAGVAGIAIGFAAKDTVANLISGVFILTDTPYKIGDYIVLDSGERGEVTDIGIRSTRILTRDDVELTIPNSIMGNSKVINESGGPHEKYRIRIPVGVAYGSDTAQVRRILMDIAGHCQKVCHYPEARVRFRAFGASSLDFELLCWVDQPALRGQVTDELLEEIYNRFNAEGVEIPYNKQDIYIKEMPAAKE